MKFLLAILAFLAFFSAGSMFLLSRTVAHEILAGIFGLAGCVLISGAAIVEAVDRLRRKATADEKKVTSGP